MANSWPKAKDLSNWAKCMTEGCGKPSRITFKGKAYCWECVERHPDYSKDKPHPWGFSVLQRIPNDRIIYLDVDGIRYLF